MIRIISDPIAFFVGLASDERRFRWFWLFEKGPLTRIDHSVVCL